MRDFQLEIEQCEDWRDLKIILDELGEQVEQSLAAPYEDEQFMAQAHELELVLRYGEQKLAAMLA